MSNNLRSENTAADLPFTYDREVGNRIGSIPVAGKMPVEEALAVLTRIYQRFAITDDNAKQVFMSTLLAYFAVNSTSDKATNEDPMTIDGVDYSMDVIKSIIGYEKVRKFARVYADRTKSIIESNNDLAQMIAIKHGCSLSLAKYAFDFGDQMHIPPGDLADVMTLRSSRLAGTRPVPSIRRSEPDKVAVESPTPNWWHEAQ